MGVYMACFALEALKKHGEVDLMLDLIKDKDCWQRMLDEGATTTFEVWSKDMKRNTSLFHPWACAPLIVLQED